MKLSNLVFCVGTFEKINCFEFAPCVKSWRGHPTSPPSLPKNPLNLKIDDEIEFQQNWTTFILINTNQKWHMSFFDVIVQFHFGCLKQQHSRIPSGSVQSNQLCRCANPQVSKFWKIRSKVFSPSLRENSYDKLMKVPNNIHKFKISFYFCFFEAYIASLFSKSTQIP